MKEPEKHYNFDVVTPDRTLSLSAASADSRDEWVAVLRIVVSTVGSLRRRSAIPGEVQQAAAATGVVLARVLWLMVVIVVVVLLLLLLLLLLDARVRVLRVRAV